MPSPLAAETLRRAAIRSLPLIAIGALAAGCGGSAHAGPATTTSTSPAANGSAAASASRARFVSCLEAHGVPASEATRGFGGRRGAPSSIAGSASSSGSAPSTSGGSVAPSTPPTTSAAFGAAFQACRSELPAGVGPGSFRNSAAGRAYLQCLQLHGVTVPSAPNGSTPAGGFGGLAANPNFQAARTACAPLAPARNGPGATSSTSAAA